MPLQTTVSFDYVRSQKGQALEFGPTRDITAYSDSPIEFGVGVVYAGASIKESYKVRYPNAVSDTFIGLTKYIHKQPRGLDNDFLSVINAPSQSSRYEIGDPITIRTIGQEFVYAEQAIAPNDPVFLRVIANGALLAGDFRKDADNASISNVALTSNVATITTSVAHGFTIGQSITIAGLTTTALNGTYTITTVPTATTFTFAKTNANIASTPDSGTIARAIAIPNARWISRNNAAGLAVIELY